MKLIIRNDAKALGLKRYFTGKPCPHGHIAERHTCNGGCLSCLREQDKRTPEDFRRKSERYWNENREVLNERARLKRERDREKVNAQARKYRATDRGRLASANSVRQRRARKRSIPGNHTVADLKKLLNASRRCYICGKMFTKASPPTVDHVLAMSHDLGTNGPANIALAHKSCNVRKQKRRINPLTGQGILL